MTDVTAGLPEVSASTKAPPKPRKPQNTLQGTTMQSEGSKGSNKKIEVGEGVNPEVAPGTKNEVVTQQIGVENKSITTKRVNF